MQETTKQEALMEFTEHTNLSSDLAQALGMSPCDGMRMAFPAIAGDEDVLDALAQIMAPAEEAVAYVVSIGGVEVEAGAQFLHGVFHLLQIAAALGHTLGVHEALETVEDLPVSLDDIPWDLAGMAVDIVVETADEDTAEEA